MDTVIERAYQLINTPIDTNLRVPFELVDIVDYNEAEPGETVEYFAADSSAVDGIYEVTDSVLTYHKIGLRDAVAISFTGLNSKLETILLDEIMNSKDQTALAVKKDSIIRSMDKDEIRRVLAAIVALDGDTGEANQEVEAETGDDILRLIIKMANKITDYATDSVLLLGADAYAKYVDYDLDNADNFHFPFPIAAELAKRGINKIIKVIGELDTGETGATQLLDAKLGILVGRNSNLVKGKPVKMMRRKFSAEIAARAGAKEGDVRLVNIADVPQPVNGGNVLGYAVYGYEQLAQVITNYRALCWSDFTKVL